MGVSGIHSRVGKALGHLVGECRRGKFTVFRVSSNRPGDRLVELFSESLCLNRPCIPVECAIGGVIGLCRVKVGVVSARIGKETVGRDGGADRGAGRTFAAAGRRRLRMSKALRRVNLVGASIVMYIAPTYDKNSAVVFGSMSTFVRLTGRSVSTTVSLLSPRYLGQVSLVRNGACAKPMFEVRRNGLCSEFSLSDASY